MTNATLEEEKKRDAEKCLQIAEGAFSSGNYTKAERFLLKSERLYPTTLAKQMLKDIKAAQSGDTLSGESSCDNSECSNTTFSGEYQTTDEDRKAAESCIAIANRAISDGRFDKAKKFLLKSIRLYPNPNDTAKELLEKLDDLKQNYSPTSYNGIGSSMLGNKDEAEKCVQIAEVEYKASRLARAERLLHKAERLCPSSRAKDLLRQIQDARAKGVKDTEEEKQLEHQKPRQNRRKNEEDQTKDERPKRIEPTIEQIEAIQRVKAARDDYQILGVDKDSKPAEVRKAFRRLTLVLHPDKNRAPGAKEAFMIVTEASERLSSKNGKGGKGRQTM